MNAPSSSPDSLSLSLSSPVDYNSYSPHDSYSSSSSSCYSSPTRLDSAFGFAQENYHFQHCNLQHCHSGTLSSWTGPQDGASNPEYAPYYQSDCLYTPVEQNYFRRDVSSADISFSSGRLATTLRASSSRSGSGSGTSTDTDSESSWVVGKGAVHGEHCMAGAEKVASG
ncbi:hypothetical protein Z043_112255 [Scleropages formosus]|uniref:Uncharacterized protein n=1 Tax=Scleropages formosus TaxID=113540 RepID=A0A0P7UGR9_SCLFO|nr:hypothetical protein Z043_112255 [Scleropages formosus]